MSSDRPTSRRFLRKPACENCRFFAFDHGDRVNNGQCRRRAPQADGMSVDRGYGVETTRRWPKVYKDEWCGEYENNPDLPTHEDLPPVTGVLPTYCWWRGPKFIRFFG